LIFRPSSRAMPFRAKLGWTREDASAFSPIPNPNSFHLLSHCRKKESQHRTFLCLNRNDETYSDPPERRPCAQAEPVCAASPPADAANRTTDLRLFYEMRKSMMQRLPIHEYFWSIDGDADFFFF
jgi:hypothetical protein